MLITGGLIDVGVKTYSEELFLPSAGTSCTLPLFPNERIRHTVDNNILCGGAWSKDTCLIWRPDSGSWEKLLTLNVLRYQHVSWTPVPGMGTYLMGGAGSPFTTTLIKDDGTQEPAFPLKFRTQ